MTKSERALWLDRLRGLAAVGMIVVHVTHAVLRTELRDTASFRLVDMAFGLVAPAFLFCVGASFALTHDRSTSTAAVDPKGSARATLFRALALFALGYGMHATGLIGYLKRGDEAELRLFLQADILQVIAIVIVALVALVALSSRWAWLALGTGVLTLAIAPTANALGAGAAAPFILPYLSLAVPTQFPLVPWVAHAFLAAASVRILRDHPVRSRLFQIATAALILAAIAWLVPWPPHDPWRSGPAYALVRFALVAGAGGVLVRAKLPSTMDRVLALFGRHSLFLYVVHVVLVYGRNPWSLRATVGPTLGVLGVVVTVLLTVVAMALVALGWEKTFRWARRS